MKERTARGPRLPCRRAPVYPDSPRSCARQRTVDWPARATSEAQLCHGARGDNTPPRPAGPRVTQESSKYFFCVHVNIFTPLSSNILSVYNSVVALNMTHCCKC